MSPNHKLFLNPGLILGCIFLSINIVLTFWYFENSIHDFISYLTVPGIILITGYTTTKSYNQSKRIGKAIIDSLKSLYLGLLIGFTSLLLLNTIFINIVANNPYYQSLLEQVNATNMHQFILQYTYQSALQSSLVSTILTIITCLSVVGSLHISTTFRQNR